MKNILKKIGLIAALGLIPLSVFAQNTNGMPQNVTTSFAARYPNAQLKKWRSIKGAYVAFFTNDNKKYTATYAENGNWVNTTRDIRRQSNLPESLRLYLKGGSYASWHIDNMRRVRTPEANFYEIVLDNHSGSPFEYEDMGSAINRELVFDDSGKLLREVTL